MSHTALAEQRTERLYEVAKMILRGDWDYGTTVLELEREWGVHRSTLHRYHAEALRMISGELGPMLEAASDHMIVETFQLKQIALNKASYRVFIDEKGDYQKELLPDPDVKAAIAAVRLRGDILGITGAHKTDHRPNMLRGKSMKEIYIELKQELVMIGKELGSEVTITEDPPIKQKEQKAIGGGIDGKEKSSSEEEDNESD